MASKQAVCSLYRRSLKLSLDWAVHRYIWRGQALYIRSLFDANKNVKEPRQQRALFQEAEDLLEKWKHPDPYRAPTAPGGSKYERNIPPPILDRMYAKPSLQSPHYLPWNSSASYDTMTWSMVD